MAPKALRALGLQVERKTDHFDQDTLDSIWLEEVGKKGWIILSKDKNLKHNHREIVALLKANTHSFSELTQNLAEIEAAKRRESPASSSTRGKKPRNT